MIRYETGSSKGSVMLAPASRWLFCKSAEKQKGGLKKAAL